MHFVLKFFMYDWIGRQDEWSAALLRPSSSGPPLVWKGMVPTAACLQLCHCRLRGPDPEFVEGNVLDLRIFCQVLLISRSQLCKIAHPLPLQRREI